MNRLKTVKSVGGVSVAALAAVLVSTLPANAQQSEIAALRQQIADLTERLNKMEADSKKVSDTAAKASPAVTARQPVTVSGLFQVQGNSLFSQSGPSAAVADTFRLRRAELRVTGKITNRISGTVMIDPTKNLALVTPAAPAVPSVNQSTNVLQELMLTYNLSQKENGANFIDVGQYKIPIGYEGDLLSSSALPLINRALMFQLRDPFGGGYGDIRETGARLRGNAGAAHYDFGVYNGFGERQNALAQSDAKAIIGRLAYRPASVPGLALGISGGTGNTGGAVRNDRTVINAFGAYTWDKWLAQAEYLQGDSQPLGGGATRDVSSYYGTLGYSFTPKLQAVARYDYFDANRNAAGFAVKDISLGLNYYIKGNNAKIQANIVHRDGTGVAAPAAGASGSGLGNIANDSTALIIQGQVAF
ncbi:MAG TPA: porin [Abditibacteriaceae bacterium]